MDEDQDLDGFEELYEPEKPKRRVVKIIGFFVIAGLIYITGVQQALFYQRTPLGTPQEITESLFDVETITVPLRIFVFQNEENFGSDRNSDDITQIVSNASDIWNQADIDFYTEQIIFLDATDEEIGLFFDNPSRFIRDLDEHYNPDAINVFFSKSLVGLPGVNGIAFTGIRTTAVADFTTVYDFRVFAHEIGHILGLDHTDDSRFRLMYRGANGFDIMEEEVLIAREEVAKF